MFDILKLLEEWQADGFYHHHVTPRMVNTLLKPVQKQAKELVKEKYPYLRVKNIEEIMGAYSFDIEYGLEDNVVLYVYLDDEEMVVGTDLYDWDRSKDKRIVVTPETAIKVIQDKISLAIKHGFITPRKIF